MNEVSKNATNTQFYRATLLCAFLIPLKLSATYVILIPTICYWLWQKFKNKESIVTSFPAVIVAPLFLWILASLFSAPFGLDWQESTIRLLRLIGFLMTIGIFFDVGKATNPILLLFAILVGQSIASFHTVIEGFLPKNYSQIFLGAVTESGQLALTVVVAAGLSLYLFCKEDDPKISKFIPIGAVLNTSLFCFISFFGKQIANILFLLSFFVLLLSVSYSVFLAFKDRNQKIQIILTTIILPLLFSALLINLKRGPWFGVCFAAILLLAKYYRKLVLPAIALIVTTIFAITPIHDRLKESYNDFFIAGGRSIMWQIGLEMAAKYPLGIGFNNSSILQKFDPEIPVMHKHFHNNFLNILVETGWLGFLIFIWWIFSLIKAGTKTDLPFPESFLLYSIMLSLVSWQAAGLVEYNFGDSEVMLVVYLVLGIMGSILDKGPVAKLSP